MLPKGALARTARWLLGSLVVSTLGIAAVSRAEYLPGEGRPFFVYLDEFQNFTTRLLADMMSELRKSAWGSRPRTRICISWSPIFGMRYLAMLGR